MNIKSRLDYHYRAFDKSQISPDPLEFLHRFTCETDIEISGIISSVFAYGNVNQIIKVLEKMHKVMGDSPKDFVLNFDRVKHSKLFTGLNHRFFTSDDIVSFLCGLNKIYKTYGSLRYLFLLYYSATDKNLKESISFFCDNILRIIAAEGKITPGLKFMFPDPKKGSACKRMNLFLRWMVRKDELDFGLWEEISTEQLVIPVDTHIARICTELKLTKRKSVSWLMAEEITENLKKHNKYDPVKYDFAICHIGMRKLKF